MMSSQVLWRESKGFAGKWLIICGFCKILLSTTCQATLQLICMLLSLYCVRRCQLFSWYLPPLGCGLDLSRLDASIFKKELLTWSPAGNLDWDLDLQITLAWEFQ
jgi:hypothetical protein